MKITVEMLRSRNACMEQVALFDRTYLDGFDVTAENLSEARKAGLDVEWATRLLPPDARTAYSAAIEPIYAAYSAAVKPIRDAAYSAAVKPIRDAYYAAVKPIRDAYYAARDRAFVEAWKMMEVES